MTYASSPREQLAVEPSPNLAQLVALSAVGAADPVISVRYFDKETLALGK
jgi:hypothetical protein